MHKSGTAGVSKHHNHRPDIGVVDLRAEFIPDHLCVYRWTAVGICINRHGVCFFGSHIAYSRVHCQGVTVWSAHIEYARVFNIGRC